MSNSKFTNPQDLLYSYTDLKIELMDAFIEDNKYLDFVIKELEALKSTNEITNTIPRKVT